MFRRALRNESKISSDGALEGILSYHIGSRGESVGYMATSYQWSKIGVERLVSVSIFAA